MRIPAYHSYGLFERTPGGLWRRAAVTLRYPSKEKAEEIFRFSIEAGKTIGIQRKVGRVSAK